MTERVLNPNNREDEKLYARMEVVASILTAYSPNEMFYLVGNTYFDKGQNWRWTTIIGYETKQDKTHQILDPRDWQNIMEADTRKKLYKAIEEIIDDRFFVDK